MCKLLVQIVFNKEYLATYYITVLHFKQYSCTNYIIKATRSPFPLQLPAWPHLIHKITNQPSKMHARGLSLTYCLDSMDSPLKSVGAYYRHPCTPLNNIKGCLYRISGGQLYYYRSGSKYHFLSTTHHNNVHGCVPL